MNRGGDTPREAAWEETGAGLDMGRAEEPTDIADSGQPLGDDLEEELTEVIDDAKTAAARAGVGVAGLPCFLGDADEGLQRLALDGEGFSREIWLVVHRDLKRSPPIRAAMDFLIEVMGNTRALQKN